MSAQHLNGQQERRHQLCGGAEDFGGGDKTVKLHVSIDLNDLNGGALQVIKSVKPSWTINQLRFKTFTDGCTNKLIGCIHTATTATPANGTSFNANGIDHTTIDDVDDACDMEPTNNNAEMVLIRIYGVNTEALIDRKREILNFQLLHRYGFAPKLLATFDNGLVYEYCDGRPLTKAQLLMEPVWRGIARHVAEMHRQVKPAPADNGASVEPMLWPKIDQMIAMIPTTFSDSVKQTRREKILPTIAQLQTECQELRAILEPIDSPVVFAHNDLLLGNILVDETMNETTIRFIDYEYAAYNYQAYDIGNHFAEFAGMDMTDIDYTNYPSKEYQLDWLREYLTHYHKDSGIAIGDDQVKRLYAIVNKFALAAHLFWCLWAHIQAEYSEIDYDFIGFAGLRYDEYMARKETFLAL